MTKDMNKFKVVTPYGIDLVTAHHWAMDGTTLMFKSWQGYPVCAYAGGHWLTVEDAEA
jgi:hypothetical protein